jgi:uncharacterized small protein (DUF1192 family)
MDAEDLLPLRADDPLTNLARQDLDRLSIAELEARIAALEAEAARARAKRDTAATTRAAADALFRRG